MPIPDQKNLVLIPSPTDHRDVEAEAVISPILGETPIPDLFPGEKTTVKDQGQKPICVGCASTEVKEYSEKKKGIIQEFDEDWMYQQCKQIDGMPDFPGTYLRSAMLILKNVGCLPKGGDPNDAQTIAKYRIAGFVRVDTTPDAIKRAIWAFGSVMAGFRGSNGGWQAAILRAPVPGEETWGHAVREYGYEISFIQGQNSWGSDWGDSGTFRDPVDYTPFEAWAIVKELPDGWQTFLPSQDEKPAYQFNNDLSINPRMNDEVKILQECLVFLGCMNREQIGNFLGYFGPKTREGVQIFQKRYGIPATGFVGPLTRAKLNALFPSAN
ncbi:MAG: peptidoglycan-binding protein [Patescibacteria group bacterium]|nr:peptidoglycan-binding protein [Patescibacteria group bacterium]